MQNHFSAVASPRFGRDELIHRRILGFQIGEWYHAVAHLDDAVSLAGVAQK